MRKRAKGRRNAVLYLCTLQKDTRINKTKYDKPIINTLNIDFFDRICYYVYATQFHNRVIVPTSVVSVYFYFFGKNTGSFSHTCFV